MVIGGSGGGSGGIWTPLAAAAPGAPDAPDVPATATPDAAGVPGCGAAPDAAAGAAPDAAVKAAVLAAAAPLVGQPATRDYLRFKAASIDDYEFQIHWMANILISNPRMGAVLTGIGD